MRAYLCAAATAALALLACDGPATSQADGSGVAASLASGVEPVIKVTGSSFARIDISGNPREIYEFNVQKDADGAVRGHVEVHFQGEPLSMHIAVACLSVAGDNAWLSGPVTRTDSPAFPIGTVIVWRLVDNGRTEAALPDRVSNFFFRSSNNFPANECDNQPPFLTFPWTDGHVTIH